MLKESRKPVEEVNSPKRSERKKYSNKRSRDLVIPVGVVMFVVVATALAVILFSNSSKKAKPKSTAKPSQKLEGIKLYNQGKVKEALPKLEAYVSGHPKDIEARDKLASSYWLTGKSKKALAEYLKILKLKPGDADTMYRLGILYRQLNDTKKVGFYLKKAVKEKPEVAIYRSELAKWYSSQRKYDKAIEQWNKVLELGPDNNVYKANVYAELGDTYLLNNDVDQAREAFKKGLSLDSENQHLKTQLQKIGG